SMMHSRLRLARNLLTDDGVIFISIDDNEQANLKRLCDEVFGEQNFIANIIPNMNPRGSQSSKDIAINHEYILIYRKSDLTKLYGFSLTEEQRKEFNKRDSYGFYREIGLRKRGADSRREDSPNLFYPIFYDEENNKLSLDNTKKFIEITPKLSDGTDGRWRWGKQKFNAEKEQLIARLVSRNNTQEYDVFQKDYLTNEKRRKAMSIWNDKVLNNEVATKIIRDMFDGEKVFEYTKSPHLLCKLLGIG